MMLNKKIKSLIKDYTGRFLNPSVIVSHQYRFVFVRIAKNASSTLTMEFSTERYEGEVCKYLEVDRNIRRDYFVFAFVRDPVERFLSGYHELIVRQTKAPFENGDYLSVQDPVERLKVFLQLVNKKKWDNHIKDQLAYLSEINLDYLGSIQTMGDDLKQIYQHLGMGEVPVLPNRRSRLARLIDQKEKNHVFFKREMNGSMISKIAEAYRHDTHLYEVYQKLNSKKALL